MTGYVVHYSDGDTDRNGSVAASSTSYNITDLSWCVTYTISVEATSEHLSRVSESAGMLNALVIVENRKMNEWVHRDAPCKKSYKPVYIAILILSRTLSCVNLCLNM